MISHHSNSTCTSQSRDFFTSDSTNRIFPNNVGGGNSHHDHSVNYVPVIVITKPLTRCQMEDFWWSLISDSGLLVENEATERF